MSERELDEAVVVAIESQRENILAQNEKNIDSFVDPTCGLCGGTGSHRGAVDREGTIRGVVVASHCTNFIKPGDAVLLDGRTHRDYTYLHDAHRHLCVSPLSRPIRFEFNAGGHNYTIQYRKTMRLALIPEYAVIYRLGAFVHA